MELKDQVLDILKDLEKSKIKVSEIESQGETREKYHSQLNCKKTDLKTEFDVVLMWARNEFLNKEKELRDNLEDLFYK